jgi:hypothetical protein
MSLTAERLRELLDYDPATGVFRWRVDRHCGKGRVSAKAGDIAGGIDGHGYHRIGIDGVRHKGHRLAWLYVHGELRKGLDHRNRDCADNRIENLRPCNQSQNMANGARRITNRSGFKGVSWSASNKGWVAQIVVRGKAHYLGTFADPAAAHAVYARAATEHFGEFGTAA